MNCTIYNYHSFTQNLYYEFSDGSEGNNFPLEQNPEILESEISIIIAKANELVCLRCYLFN